MSQNVPIPQNCSLPTHTNHLLTLSVKIGSVPTFSPCSKHQSYHLVGYHAYLTNNANNAFSKNICK